MEMQVVNSDKAVIVSIIGSIDILTSEKVAEGLALHLKDDKNVLLDLAQVNFMSSAGLRVVLRTLKEARQRGGDLYLAAAQPGVEKVLKLSGFHSILHVFGSVDEALSGIELNT
jgi:anti-sigma B factor antagonist